MKIPKFTRKKNKKISVGNIEKYQTYPQRSEKRTAEHAKHRG